MAHHSSEHPLSDEYRDLYEGMEDTLPVEVLQLEEKLRKEQLRLGATGRFPAGKFGPHDEGEIRFAVGAEEGKILIDFGKSIRSMGMEPEQADSLAQLLMEKARQVRAQSREDDEQEATP